jgi:peptide/nickel transport system substrate-binding protein
MMRRRTFTAGAVAMLVAPLISRGSANALLKFIPQSDPTILNPIVTTVHTARNHGYMLFDPLFGMDSAYQMQPQTEESFSI